MSAPAGGWLDAADADAEGRTRWVDASDPAAVDAWGSGAPASAPVLALNPKFDPRCAYLAAAADAGADGGTLLPHPELLHASRPILNGAPAAAPRPPATDALAGGAAARGGRETTAPGEDAGAVELGGARALSLELLAATRLRQLPFAEAVHVPGAGADIGAAPAGEAADSTEGSPGGSGEDAGSAESAGQPAQRSSPGARPGAEHVAGDVGAGGPAGAVDMESAGAPSSMSHLLCLPALPKPL